MRRPSAALSLTLALTSALAVAAVGVPSAPADARATAGQYIVRFKDTAVSAPASGRSSRSHVQIGDTASGWRVDGTRVKRHLSAVRSMGVRPKHVFQHGIGGFSAKLTAAQVRATPGRPERGRRGHRRTRLDAGRPGGGLRGLGGLRLAAAGTDRRAAHLRGPATPGAHRQRHQYRRGHRGHRYRHRGPPRPAHRRRRELHRCRWQQLQRRLRPRHARRGHHRRQGQRHRHRGRGARAPACGRSRAWATMATARSRTSCAAWTG